MLALDSLLQQVVSTVTASDPVYNPDETTLKARAILRESSLSLSPPSLTDGRVQQGQESFETPEVTTPVQSLVSTASPQIKSPSHIQHSISQMPIAGMATSSLERLDELARKVDQLTVVVSEDSYSYPSHILREPLDIPSRHQISTSVGAAVSARTLTSTAAVTRIEPAQIFESQEYQLACTLAALLACIYKILNRMQEPRIPLRTESADFGLDQASRLWKRLSSNSFGRIGSSSHSIKHHLISSSSANNSAESSLLERKKQAVVSVHSGTNGWMQSINRQVRTLRSRRTQSTSHIEVPARSLEAGKRPSRLFGIGSSSSSASPPTSSALTGLHPLDAAQSENARELEQNWTELDKLMEEMSQLWKSVEGLEDDDEEEQIASIGEETEEDMSNPFHDSHQHTRQELAVRRRPTVQDTFDQQTLDLVVIDDLPEYDDAPQYRTLENKELNGNLSVKAQSQEVRTHNLTRRASRATLSGGLEDEKTRFDLNNVMSAIERLCKVTPRLDNQRVQLSASQKRQMASADVAGTIERLSQGRWEDQRAYSAAAAFKSRQAEQRHELQYQQEQEREMTRDLNMLVSQIVESAKTDIATQRAELSPRQQWRLEGARISDRIERGEKMRLSGQV